MLVAKHSPLVGRSDLRFWFSLAVVLGAAAVAPLLVIGGHLAAALSVAFSAPSFACAPYAIFPRPRRQRRP